MWGDYLEKGQMLEKAGLPSMDAHGAMESFGLYVSADIATSFTLLVGIFFPSATGKPVNPNLATKLPRIMITAHTMIDMEILNHFYEYLQVSWQALTDREISRMLRSQFL